MPRRLAGLLLVAAALLAPAAAHAADPAVDDETFDWAGLRVGVFGGYGRLGGDGALAGASLGYDWRFDDVLVGVEGDLAGGGLDARRSGGRYEIDAFGSIRARVGYAFDRFVVYGTAGVAFASADYARNGRSDDATQMGWTAGFGLEAHLFGRLSAKVEYLYVDLDRKTYAVDGDVGIAASGGQVRVGLNYRF